MIYLSLGSNLPSKFGDRFENINIAISNIKKKGIVVIKKSSFYESPSYPNKNNPKFINLIISIKSEHSPKDLMSILINIEKKLQRKRKKKNEPRTCDIDIIDYNSVILKINYKKSKLIIPHKNLESRNFVLFPLEEVAPNWHHPQSKVHIHTLINKLSTEDRKSILKIKKY